MKNFFEEYNQGGVGDLDDDGWDEWDDDEEEEDWDEEEDDDGGIGEGVKRKRVRKMRGAEKTKAKRYYKRNRKKILRKQKKKRKKSTYKRQKKRRDRKKKGKKVKKGYRLVVDNDQDFSFNLDRVKSIVNSMKEKI